MSDGCEKIRLIWISDTTLFSSEAKRDSGESMQRVTESKAPTIVLCKSASEAHNLADTKYTELSHRIVSYAEFQVISIYSDFVYFVYPVSLRATAAA